MSSSKSSSLRPTWYKGSGAGGGRGFQPPPTASERGDKGRSSSWGSQERSNSSNAFAVLDDEDGPPQNNGASDERPAGNSRSEAFRSSYSRSLSTGTKPAGRSLADLAARVPDSGPTNRRHSSYDTRAAGPGRFSNVRSTESGAAPASSTDNFKPDPTVIRYTKEKLLSMRPAPKPGAQGLPEALKPLEGANILSEVPQDPVCWDSFDGEEIWEQFRERRLASGVPKVEGVPAVRPPETTAELRRRNAPSSGRWQRGVALPPAEAGGRRKDREAENPNELWDDPIGGATGAATDFSAFGAMPDDGEAFDFEKVTEASRKLDEEIHGPREEEDLDENGQPHSVKAVDTTRPLSSAGTTITSGSGDDVNVFEDFDAPGAEAAPEKDAPGIRSASEDPTASSRLMKMIGVEPPKADDNAVESTDNPWGAEKEQPASTEQAPGAIDPIFGSIGGISLNPWGSSGGQQQTPPEDGMDLAARLEALAAEQKAREAQVEMEKRAQHEAELLRRRQEEEAQRRAMAQRQAEDQARQQQVQQAAAMQQQPQASQQSQVELVLMERICSILENSWGRSDLGSILTTLHSEDSRVIPLLGNVDALRALIARSPQRIALRRDPSFAGDMAVLVLTNTQWRQQQQQVQARIEQEELQRRRLEEEARAQVEKRASVQINPDLPWFYSDPQNNIQGPFRGEEMRQWLEAGYFKGDLPISQQPSGPFHPLSALFPDLSVAFRGAPATKAEEEEAERKAAGEEEQQREQEAERQAAEAAAKEKEALAAAEREKEELERQAAAQAAEEESANSKGNANESSDQLKMMLGLASGGAPSETPEVEEKKPIPSKKQPQEKRGAKGGKKNQPKPAEEPAPAPAPSPVETSPPAVAASAAWGGAASSKPKKSMSEIQQEEARAAAINAAQSGGSSRQPSSGWANVAAGTQGWSSGVVKSASAAVPNTAPGARPVQQRAKSQGAAQPATAAKNSATNMQQHSGATSADEFGAKMPPALEKWSKEQMLRLNGSDDLTLVAFCMTLNDASEIRQYLTTYLGASPQVNSFATEFIDKRGLGARQEEWETPGSAKKGRKKKTGPR